MSNKIILPNGPTGRTAGAAGGFYAVIQNAAGDVYDTTTATTFTAINTITWTNADVQLTEVGSTGQYTASFPATITAGLYTIEIREQFGSTPNVLNDRSLAGGRQFWDGTNLTEANNGPLAAQSYAADGSEPTAAQMMYMTYAMRQAVVSGTSYLVKGLDGTTTVMTFTLDDASNPTQMIRTA